MLQTDGEQKERESRAEAEALAKGRGASLALLVLWSFGPLDQHTSHCPLLLLFSKSRCRCYCLSLLPCYLGQQFNLLLPLNA